MKIFCLHHWLQFAVAECTIRVTVPSTPLVAVLSLLCTRKCGTERTLLLMP